MKRIASIIMVHNLYYMVSIIYLVFRNYYLQFVFISDKYAKQFNNENIN